MSQVVIQSLISAGGTVLAVIISCVISFLLTKFKSKGKESSKINSEIVDASCKVASKVLKNSPVTVNTDKLIELMEEAEAHDNFSSVEKLDYVLTSYQQYCIDSNFKFVKEVIVEAITKLIDMTKKVNKRPKDVVSEGVAKQTNSQNEQVPVRGIYS